MRKKSIFGCLLGLSLPFLVASCADLRDADECYRWARLFCEKSCIRSDSDSCITELRNECYDASSDLVEDELASCSDKLAELDDCVGAEAVNAACVTGPQIGDACVSYTDCGNLSCGSSGRCTRSCTFDSDCSTYTTRTGAQTYCDTTDSCSAACTTDADCTAGMVCDQSGGTINLCRAPRAITTPEPTSNIGDPCELDTDCAMLDSQTCELGFCTKQCLSQSDCSVATGPSGASCVRPSGALANMCLPSCSAGSTCAVGSACRLVPAVGGASLNVCLSTEGPGAKKLLGGACSLSSDCDLAATCQQGICTKSCTSDVQCSGQTVTGTSARCALTGGDFWCLPTCTASASTCDLGTTCVAATLASGAAYVCHPQGGETAQPGEVGSACKASTDCDQNADLTCQFGMCTRTCFADFCPDVSPPETSLCGPNDSCTVTCDTKACAPGWICAYDEASGLDVCQR